MSVVCLLLSAVFLFYRRPAEESSESEETEDEVFDVVDFVRGDVEERTCVYRQLG